MTIGKFSKYTQLLLILYTPSIVIRHLIHLKYYSLIQITPNNRLEIIYIVFNVKYRNTWGSAESNNSLEYFKSISNSWEYYLLIFNWLMIIYYHYRSSSSYLKRGGINESNNQRLARIKKNCYVPLEQIMIIVTWHYKHKGRS